MEFERSLPSSKKPATCPQPEPQPYIPHFLTYFFNTLSDKERNTVIFIFITDSVGIATRYGLDGPGIETQWEQIFRTRPEGP